MLWLVKAQNVFSCLSAVRIYKKCLCFSLLGGGRSSSLTGFILKDICEILLTNLSGLYQELRRSLELSVSQKRMEKESSSDDYDSVEEDVLLEHSQVEETVASFGSLQLPSGESLLKDVPKYQEAGRCCDLDAGALVLEFKQNPTSKSLCPVPVQLQRCSSNSSFYS